VDGSPALIDGRIVVGNHGRLVQVLDPAPGADTLVIGGMDGTLYGFPVN